MLKNKKSVLVLVAAIIVPLVMLAGAPASAAVVTVAQLRMGEANPEAVNGGALVFFTGVKATVGNPLDGVGGGAPTWSVDTPAAYQLPLGASTFSVAFKGPYAPWYSSNIYGTSSSTATDLVGMEAWVKANTTFGDSWIVLNGEHNGVDTFNGYGFYQTQSTFRAHLPGVASVGDAPVVVGEWTHLAMVFDSTTGGGRFYVNGVQNGATFGAPGTPGGLLQAGAEVAGTGGGGAFDGKVDELRIFTFAAGGFNVSDLNYAVPEPMTMALLGLGGVLVLVRRQRR